MGACQVTACATGFSMYFAVAAGVGGGSSSSNQEPSIERVRTLLLLMVGLIVQDRIVRVVR